MADQDQKRDRSPNYPYISLPMALERVRALYDAEKRGAAAVPVVARHWGYSPKSSGLIQTIAALKSYGLVEEEGRGADRRIRLSEPALRIILDQRPQSSERAELLTRAAAMPAIAQRIVEKFPDDVPSDHNLEHFLIFDLKFNPDSAKAAVKLFKENAVYTGLYGGGIISSTEATIGEPMESSAAALPARQASTGASIKIPGALVPAAVERIIGPTGDIVVQFLGEATLEAYQFLEDYIKLRKAVLKPPSGLARGTAEGEAKQEKSEEVKGLRRSA